MNDDDADGVGVAAALCLARVAEGFCACAPMRDLGAPRPARAFGVMPASAQRSGAVAGRPSCPASTAEHRAKPRHGSRGFRAHRIADGRKSIVSRGHAERPVCVVVAGRVALSDGAVMRCLGLATRVRVIGAGPSPLPVVRSGRIANNLGATSTARPAPQDQGSLEYLMMPPTYNDRPATPSAENTALTVAAHGARRGMAAPKHRVPSDRQGRQAVVLAQRMQTRWTLQRLREAKTDPILAMVQQIAIQYPR